MSTRMKAGSGIAAWLTLLAWASGVWADTSPPCGDLPNFACATASDTLTGTYDMTSATPFVFEGATADAFETTVSIGDPGADRTVFIPGDGNSATAKLIDCSAGQHVDAFDPATGAFTCTADSGGTHDLLSATHTDTAASTVTRGDLIVGTATPAWDDLAIGSANTVLASNGTDPAWTALSSSHIGAGDLANALIWDTLCTASPCTLPTAPRTADTALVVHHTLSLRRVAACGGINEYTLSGTTLTFCGTAPSTGADAARVISES